MTIKGIPFVIAETILHDLDQKKTYIAEFDEEKAKRSKDQNAYYWELLDKYADYLKMSKNELHRRMISDYGQRIKNKIIPLKADYDYLKETDEIYLRPSQKFFVDKKGQKWQYFFICRGSSSYNTKEMSILIDGLINDIKGSEAKIETLTERERIESWGPWL